LIKRGRGDKECKSKKGELLWLTREESPSTTAAAGEVKKNSTNNNGGMKR